MIDPRSSVFVSSVWAAKVHPSGWVPFGDGLEITAAPLVDEDYPPLFARLTYRTALAVAERLGARLLTQAEHDELARVGRRLRPVIKTPGPRMASLEYAQQHDAELLDQLQSWDGKTPLCNAGKQWVHGAPKGRAWNYGWWDSAAPNGVMWQRLGTTHDDQHTDYSQLTMLVRPREGAKGHETTTTTGAPTMTPRPTIRRGDKGEHVAALQGRLGLTADGIFGPATEARAKGFQHAEGLVADGIVGARTWAALGEVPAVPATASGGDPCSPACRAALRDANSAWPRRSKKSDGIMGDAAHKARKSDHNAGNAVDITHDPASGADGEVISMLAIQDPRVTYVIWDRRIFSRARANEAWRPYTKGNPHTHHVHISVREDARADASPWPWAPR